MNIFFVGLNINFEVYKKVFDSKNSILKEVFTEFENWQEYIYSTENKRNSIFLFYSSSNESYPRNYVSENEDYILFYSGLPVYTSKNSSPHDAKELLKYFDDIKYDFEGQASIIRYNKNTYDTDIITDVLGMEQVYYYFRNNQLIISNHIKLIEIVSQSTKIDLKSAAYYLSIGWVPDNYTLRENIYLIKGGRHWKWDGNKKIIAEKIYFDPAEIRPNSKEALKKDRIKELTKNMQDYLLLLDSNFNLECPLTGGYDSRLVAALLIDKNVRAKYYTTGNLKNIDVKIASMIASKFNLSYRVYDIDYKYLFDNWECLIKKFLLQSNGMTDLWQLSNILTHLDSKECCNPKLTVRLSTHGAEASRNTYNRPHLWEQNITRNDVYNYLTCRFLKNSNEILTNFSVELYYNFFNSFFETLTEKGMNYRLIPDYFYIFERVGRYHANGRILNRNIADKFSLFCTQTYLKTALQLHPLDKVTYPIHYRMMKNINKQLFLMPNNHGKWPIQNKKINRLWGQMKPVVKGYLHNLRFNNRDDNITAKKTITTTYTQELIYKTKIDEFRNIIFDQSNSDLWMLIKKEKLESIFSKKKNIENASLNQLFVVATLFYYECISK